ncbi:MAG: hypothetical protein QOJ39_1432 [Candidatus Eremiobacteraeota bacterium]|jgi:hypothetical protein|nr:hypothetical protein [Candidatus Eremiobacteraeota bacterium]
MPRISPAEFSALPLRVNTLLADVPLHDVWAVDLPALREGVTLEEVLRRAGRDVFGSRDTKTRALPAAGRALFRLRLLLGRLFRLERRPKDAEAASFARRLTVEDRACSSVVSGTRAGNFSIVYRFDNEQLLEVHNRTVHAGALSALSKTAEGYRYYLAVYVASVGWITPIYMALIDPFRRWIIYPALLKSISASCSAPHKP